MRWLLVLALAVCVAARVRYDGYKVFRVTPQTPAEVKLLRVMEHTTLEVDFWTEVRGVGIPVDVMLTPELAARAAELFQGIQHDVINDDVQADITEKWERLNRKAPFDLFDYNSLAEIELWLLDLPNHCPPLHMCEIIVIGESYERKPIRVFHMHRPGLDRKAHWIDATIHAREWLAAATMINFMDKLVKHYDEDVEARRLADEYDWYLLPMANPDGYHFSYEVDDMWRKNRRMAEENPLDCVGVDLNRNFDWTWGTEGVSPLPCSQIYPGPSAASENETQAMQNAAAMVADHTLSWTTIHAYGYMWMFPWGTTVDHAGEVCARTEYHDQLMRVADAAADALGATHDTYWYRGTSCEVIYETSGATDDYVFGAHGIKYAFCPELRGNNFNPPPAFIQPSSEEFWNGIVAMVDQIAIEEGL